MIINRIINFILLLVLLLFIACSPKQEAAQNLEKDQGMLSISQVETPIKALRDKPHDYGGWSCPDNLRSFPPVNLAKFEKIPVVNDRLPTEEETQNGSSLLYFNSEKYPDARPIDLVLPKLARHYSEYTKKNELVIAIQAVEVNNDTVVGYRYLNGGNGSAWFSEMSFLSAEELEKIGQTPFVYSIVEINASKENVWQTITSSENAAKLGHQFAKEAIWESDLRDFAKIQFKGDAGETLRTGIVSALWGNLYIQIDYNTKGNHFVEKVLLLTNEETRKTELHLVVGPFKSDFKVNKQVWEKWISNVKELSEST